MSDLGLSNMGSLSVKFPDGTSKVFKGADPDEINSQAAAYWSKKHPAPKLPASPNAPFAPQRIVPLPPAIPRSAIDAYRLQNFNSDNPNENINLKMAHALAANPNDASYLHRYKNLDPVAQRAISEKADEIAHAKTLTVNTAGLGPGGIPAVMDKKGNQEPIQLPSQVLARLIHGPEGAKQLANAKGFGPEAERLALGAVDPESVLMMLGGGTIGSLGPWAARGVTAAFAGALGKSAYDKFRANDPGGAFADLSLAGAGVAAHGLVEKSFAKGPKFREPPPPNPTTAQVHEPSGLGPGPEPAPEPPPRPEPPPSAGAQEPPRARRPKASQRTRPQSPPSTPQPESPYVPIDLDTPHPEVDKFKAYADKYAPNIKETADIAAAKQRVAELGAKRKLTINEKAEFVKANNTVEAHNNGLNEIAARYEAATGRKLPINTASTNVGDTSTATGRTEVIDKVRQVLRANQTTFEKMFPDAEPAPEPAAETPKTGKRSSKKAGMLDIGPGAPGSPQEKFMSWLKDQPMTGVYTKAAELFKSWRAVNPGTTRQEFGQMFQGVAASPEHEVVTPSANVKKGDVFEFKDSTGIMRRVTGVRPARVSQAPVEQPSTDVSRETPKPGRFTALEETDAAKEDAVDTTRGAGNEAPVAASQAGSDEAIPQNLDEGSSRQDAQEIGKRFGKRSPKTAGYVDFGPLPPKSGAGPVGRVLHHGPEITNAMNKFDASTVSAQVRGHFLEDQLYEGLDPVQRDALDEWLVGNRFEHEANSQTDPAKAAAIRAHPQYVQPADLANLASFPGVQDAIDRYKDEIKPTIDEMSGKAGVSAQAIAGQSPHYIRLVPEDILGQGTPAKGFRGAWESRARPKSTGARKAANIGARVYSTDVGAILRHVVRDVEPKAALNDLWRTLDAQGKIAVPPSGTAGRGWKPPDGYVGDEIQGKFSSMPADLVAKYGGKGRVYLPQDIVQSMDEVTAPPMFSGSRVLNVTSKLSRALISTTLGLNVPAVPWHIYRQTGLLRASTALADAKRNPATVLAGSIPIVGTLAKGAAIASRNADDPIYRAVIQHLVEINAISPRSMEGLTGNIGRLPLLERWNAILHDSMFGMPHGRGVNGWAIRVAVEAYLARARFEQTNSPERDREYIAQFGAYMRRVSPFFGVLADHNPFTRTHGPRIVTSVKMALGDTGLKVSKQPGESEATFRLRQAAHRIGNFAMHAAPVVVGLIVLNKVLSGKYPWENGKGHELDVNLGHGHFVPIHRMIPELGPPMELAGLASRMHRERTGTGGSIPKFSTKMRSPQSSSPVMEALGDTAIGAGNVGLGMVDSPALNAGAAILNKRMYLQYDKRAKGPDLMSLSPSSATDAQRAINTVTTITGASTIVPTQGYADDGTWSIGKAFIDYLTQGAVKVDHPGKTKKMKVR